jgi:hypothetical protein
MSTTTNQSSAPLYIIMTRRSAEGRGRFGCYNKLALVRLTPAAASAYANEGKEPAMISTRARGVAEIVDVIEPLHTGLNYPRGRCRASRTYRVLELAAAALNSTTR